MSGSQQNTKTGGFFVRYLPHLLLALAVFSAVATAVPASNNRHARDLTAEELAIDNTWSTHAPVIVPREVGKTTSGGKATKKTTTTPKKTTTKKNSKYNKNNPDLFFKTPYKPKRKQTSCHARPATAGKSTTTGKKATTKKTTTKKTTSEKRSLEARGNLCGYTLEGMVDDINTNSKAADRVFYISAAFSKPRTKENFEAYRKSTGKINAYDLAAKIGYTEPTEEFARFDFWKLLSEALATSMEGSSEIVMIVEAGFDLNNRKWADEGSFWVDFELPILKKFSPKPTVRTIVIDAAGKEIAGGKTWTI